MTDRNLPIPPMLSLSRLKVSLKLSRREKPDALLPTLGGQTGLNLSLELFEKGILKANGVEMIGAKPDAIKKREDRELFKQAMLDIGLDVARSFSVNSVEEAQSHLDELGFRSSFVLPTPWEDRWWNRLQPRGV